MKPTSTSRQLNFVQYPACLFNIGMNTVTICDLFPLNLEKVRGILFFPFDLQKYKTLKIQAFE